MTITRTFCSASLLALAAIMGPVAPGYASEPCCDCSLVSGHRGRGRVLLDEILSL